MALAHGLDDGEPLSGDRPPEEAVRAQLARILASPNFKATPRRRHMLEYLVEEMLAGREDRIKGYNIGVSVFGRSEGYDPQLDPIVRAEARRLRQDLAFYYMGTGENDPLRLSIPKGGYVPLFEPNETHQVDDLSKRPLPRAGLKQYSVRLSEFGVRWFMLAGFVAILLVSGIGVTAIFVLAYHLIDDRPAASTDSEIRQPAVAIMPFEDPSANEQDRLLAAGISNRLVSELNRYPSFRIYIPKIPAGQWLNSDPALSETRSNISYVVAGSLRSDESTVEVSARLVDAQTDEVLWAETYERVLNPGSLIAIEGEIATEIASTLGQSYGVIRNEITKKLPDEFIPTMSSYECVLRGYDYRRTFLRSLYEPVLACLENAVQTDPNYAEAWALLGYMHIYAVPFGHVGPSEFQGAYAKAIEAAMQALALDRDNVMALKVLSLTNHLMGNYSESDRYIRLALEKNPHDPDSLAQRGWRLSIRGDFAEGVPLLERAISRSVKPPDWYFHLLAIDRLMKKDGDGMLAMAEIASASGSARGHSLMAMANGLLNRPDAAEQALRRMVETQPNYDPVESWRRHQATDEILDVIAAAMHSAGWVEPSLSANR